MMRSYLLALALGCVACGGSPPAGEPAAVHRVRGQIVELHGSGADRRVSVAHEAIPGFKDRSGVAAVMPAMTMAFGIAPGVDAKGFAPASKWSLTVEVVWGREPMLLITGATPLPAGTVLAVPSGGHH